MTFYQQDTVSPRISVVIPVFGSPDLEPLLYGLTRQSLPKFLFEVIIVDDATPESKRIDYQYLKQEFKDLDVRLLYCEKNGGPGSARNVGVRAARGDIIFFTDDDCVPAANWLEQHWAIYVNKPSVSAVGGWYGAQQHSIVKSPYQIFLHLTYQINSRSDFDLYTTVARSDDYDLSFSFRAHNTANLSIKKSILINVGGFNPLFITPGFEDMELIARVREAGFVVMYIPQIMEHTKDFDFKSYRRFLKNRACGAIVYEMLLSRKSETWYRLFQTFIKHKQFATVVGQLPYLWRVKVRMVALLFYWYLYSSFMRHITVRRLRKKIVLF